MPGVVFDRAASFYDATRGLPPGVAEQVRDQIALCTSAGHDTRFLEIGVGTGRIALPFVQIGADYTGADLSLPMMEVMRKKIAAISKGVGRLKLALADAMVLPFADASFDVIIMIQLLHLVSDWRQTLRECRRVLRDGGWLVLSSNERAEQKQHDVSASRRPDGLFLVRQKWNEIINELDQDRSRQPGSQWLANEEVCDALAQMGATVRHVTLAEYQNRPITAREMASLHRDRIFSSDWHHSDDVHAVASRRLERWLEHEHPAPDASYQAQVQFSVLLAHWASASPKEQTTELQLSTKQATEKRA
jgi:ubiquinone/menaquinone biosynthesis C-methylase UbiE